MSSSRDELQQASYLSLGTFRKSGVVVPTPVWAAWDQGIGYVFSAGAAGKVKRLRNSTRAQVAKCDVRGKVLGDWHEASAEILMDETHIQRGLEALRKKYGLQMWLADVGSRLVGKFNKRAYIAIHLTD